MQQQAETAPQSPVMDLKQAAEYMHATVPGVRALIYKGILSYQRVGKKHVVPRREVEQHVERSWRRNGK